jgi:hypothetical protein
MRSRTRRVRENRRFSCLEKVPEDFFHGLLTAIAVILGLAAAARADEAAAVAAIRAVGREGAGNEAAAAAWKELARSDAARLPAILAAMDGASPLAANWLATAVDAVAARGRTLPLAELRGFLADTAHDPHARRLAFELIRDRDPAAAEALVAGMLDDPSGELRRDAVAREIAAAAAARKEERKTDATAGYRRALSAARDIDQIKAITKPLEELGEKVDLPRQFGFLVDWQVVAPFDNKDGAGFAAEYPPEKNVDLAAAVAGRDGPVSWKPLSSADPYGMVDLNVAYPGPDGGLKEVAGYAFTEYVAAAERDAELRLGCKNAWKLWHNGRLLFGRDEYHRGMKIDQYRMPIRLAQGRNTFLVKLCQDAQKQDWTKEWQFQLRVCDRTGAAILAVDRPPSPSAATTTTEKTQP